MCGRRERHSEKENFTYKATVTSTSTRRPLSLYTIHRRAAHTRHDTGSPHIATVRSGSPHIDSRRVPAGRAEIRRARAARPAGKRQADARAARAGSRPAASGPSSPLVLIFRLHSTTPTCTWHVACSILRPSASGPCTTAAAGPYKQKQRVRRATATPPNNPPLQPKSPQHTPREHGKPRHSPRHPSSRSHSCVRKETTADPPPQQRRR